MDKGFVKSIENIVGDENVLSDDISLYAHSYDATTKIRMPELVVIPQEISQISPLISLCNEKRVSITARGAGSGFTGGTLPIKGGIVLVLDELTGIEMRYNPYPHLMAEVGAITTDVQDFAEGYGYLYPPDPASQAFSTIGGNIAVGAGGPRGLKYGTTRDYVLGLDVILASGEEKRLRIWNSPDDMKLIALMTGSEGTLGIITRTYLRIVSPTEVDKTMMLRFKDVSTAMKTVAEIISLGITPARLEFIDDKCVESIRGYTDIEVERGSILLLIEEDGTEEDVDRALDTISQLQDRLNILEIITAKDSEEAEMIWDMRRAISPSMAKYGPTKVNEDITVPMDRLVELLSAIEEMAEKHQIFIGNFGHVGDGNIHMTIMVDKRDEELMEKAETTVARMFEKTIELGGTISGEHGVGIMKMPYLSLEKSEREIEIYRKLKHKLDPDNILNPGKFFYDGTTVSTN